MHTDGWYALEKNFSDSRVWDVVSEGSTLILIDTLISIKHSVA